MTEEKKAVDFVAARERSVNQLLELQDLCDVILSRAKAKPEKTSAAMLNQLTATLKTIDALLKEAEEQSKRDELMKNQTQGYPQNTGLRDDELPFPTSIDNNKRKVTRGNDGLYQVNDIEVPET